MRRLLPLLVVAVLVSLAMPAVAAPPVSETTVQHDLVENFVELIPSCEGEGGDLYDITTTSTLVEHETLFGDGRGHATFTQTGTFEAEPLDPTGQSASGHFTSWGGFNLTNSTVNGTFTFNLQGEFEDGTRFSIHAVDHFNVIPSGTEFFFSRCHD